MTTRDVSTAMRDSASRRFLTKGLPQLESRLARLTAPIDEEDARVRQVLEDSALVRLIDRVVEFVAVSRHDSAVIRAVKAEWQAQVARADRRHASAGVLILSAVVTYLVLTIAVGDPAGWFRIIVPAVAAAVGAVLLVAPRRADSADRN